MVDGLVSGFKNNTAKQTTSAGDKHKQSTKSADEKVYFEVEEHFVDDYQHYPSEDQRFVIKHEDHRIVYSLCKKEDNWANMIAEDRQVTIHVKINNQKNIGQNQAQKLPPAATPQDDGLTTSQKNKSEEIPKSEECRSSWITHMMSTE